MNHCSYLTILVIDDCLEDLQKFREFLQQDSLYTYRIFDFETATQAREWCQHHIPDVIVLNVVLSDGNGLDFLEQLRKTWSNHHSAVILLTEQEDVTTAVRAMKSGAQDYLVKHKLTPALFQEAIHHAVKSIHENCLLEQSREQQKLMAGIALRIRQFLKLEEIINATVKEVRQYLQADRVVVFQFHPDMSGTIVAESVLPGWTVSLGSQIRETCFQQTTPEGYQHARNWAVDNVYQAGLTGCHLKLLAKYEVKANLVVPILVTNKLWGLLIAHQCSGYRHWEAVELDLLDQLAVQIAIAIQQASAYEQLQLELAERKRTEEALRTSEQKLQLALDFAHIGYKERNLLTNEIFVTDNGNCCIGNGITERKMSFEEWLSLIHPEDQERVQEALHQAIANQSPYAVEYRIINNHDCIHWVSALGRGVYDANGQPQLMLSIFMDISQRKQAEEILRESEERFRHTFEQAAVGMAHVSLTGKFLRLNRRFCEIADYPQAELQTLTFQEITHPDDLERDIEQLQKLLNGEIETYCIDKRYIRKDESSVWVNLTVSLVREPTGEPKYLISVIKDITQSRQAQAALKESEARFAAFMNNSPSISWITDEHGRIVYLSQTYLSSLQLQTEALKDLIGKSVFQVYPPEIAQKIFENIRRVIDTHQTLEFIEQAPRRDGTLGYFLVYKFPLQGASGELLIGGVGIDITERIYSEQALEELNQQLEARVQQRTAALRASEERWQLVLRGTNDGIWDWDIKTNQVFFSTRWKQMRGFAEDEISSNLEEWSSRIYPEDFDHVMNALGDHFAQKTPFFQAEYRIQRKDGSYMWVLDRGQALWDEAGEVVRMCGSQTDITRRKQAEQELISSRALREAIFNQSADALFLVDGLTLVIQDCNQKAVEMFAVKEKSEMIGIAGHTLHRQEFTSEDLAQMSFELETKGYWSQEIEYVTRQGKYFWGHITIKVITVSGGKLNLVRVTDITERKQAEAALAKYAHEVEDLYNNAPCGYHSLDKEGRFVNINQTELEWLGYTREEVIGKSINEFITPVCKALFAKHYPLFQETGWIKDLEYELVCKDGTIFPVLVSATVVRDAEGKYLYSRSTLFDLRQRKQADERNQKINQELALANVELARVTRLKDEFLANMSHELRTPLNAILGMSEGFQEGVFGFLNKRQKSAIATIERSGQHLLELINDILDLSKIESGKLELEINEVSVRSLCDASLTFVRQMALKKNIHLSIDIANNIGSIQADNRRLRQVLINLLSNAVKFTPSGGSVKLQVRRQEAESANSPPQICFCVIDTGIGISQENISKLFQPFIQIDSSLNRQYNGTGLGLALVQRIVTLHGGTVTVNSTLGKGSCFTVSIPYLSNDPLPLTLATSSLSHPYLLTKNSPVLIIEDSIPAADQISRYLSEMGMQFIVYARGEGANEEAIRVQPSLIILDLQLPDLSGWQVLNQLKLNPQTRDIPVVIISVVDETSQGLAQGAFAHLVKPITRNQLQGTLDKLQFSTANELPIITIVPHSAHESPVILLAEDNQANIDTITGYLETRGYNLLVANNGQQAIHIAKARHPHLILMDIQMPQMDGLEAIRHIRNDQGLVHVPIIALTALAMSGDRETCLAAGANEYLTKPVKLKQLVVTIQQLLRR